VVSGRGIEFREANRHDARIDEIDILRLVRRCFSCVRNGSISNDPPLVGVPTGRVSCTAVVVAGVASR